MLLFRQSDMSGDFDSRSTPGVARFPNTLWKDVLAAKDRSHPQTQEALARLCQAYQYPVYVFIRRKGNSRHDAQDLTQEFFARLIEKDYLKGVEQEEGKFRTFLLTAVTRFLCNEFERSHAQKRGGGATMFTWDADEAEAAYCNEPAHDLSPEKLFDRNWADSLTKKAMEDLRAEYRIAGKERVLEVLEIFVIEDGEGYREAAQALDMSEGAARTCACRIRERYRELLREAIAETVNSEADIDEEWRALYSALGG